MVATEIVNSLQLIVTRAQWIGHRVRGGFN